MSRIMFSRRDVLKAFGGDCRQRCDDVAAGRGRPSRSRRR